MNPKMFDGLTMVGGKASIIGGIIGFVLALIFHAINCSPIGPCPPGPNPITWMIYGAIPGAVYVVGKFLLDLFRGNG